VVVPRPRIGDDGAYEANPDGHPIRVYSNLDVRLMFEDLYTKLELVAACSTPGFSTVFSTPSASASAAVSL
jgi:hypothetical protein